MMNDLDRIVTLVMKAYHSALVNVNHPTSDTIELYIRRALMQEYCSTKKDTKTLLQG